MFAILVGLILGYVAMKYSVKWSILLHVINNFIFGDLLSYMTLDLNESMQYIIFYVMEGIFLVLQMLLRISEIEKMPV
jgi:uncharacterized protein